MVKEQKENENKDRKIRDEKKLLNCEKSLMIFFFLILFAFYCYLFKLNGFGQNHQFKKKIAFLGLNSLRWPCITFKDVCIFVCFWGIYLIVSVEISPGMRGDGDGWETTCDKGPRVEMSFRNAFCH